MYCTPRMNWGWVNNRVNFHFGVNYPFKCPVELRLCHIFKLYVRIFTAVLFAQEAGSHPEGYSRGAQSSPSASPQTSVHRANLQPLPLANGATTVLWDCYEDHYSCKPSINTGLTVVWLKSWFICGCADINNLSVTVKPGIIFVLWLITDKWPY